MPSENLRHPPSLSPNESVAKSHASNQGDAPPDADPLVVALDISALREAVHLFCELATSGVALDVLLVLATHNDRRGLRRCELSKHLPPCADKTLTLALRDLEGAGLIRRETLPSVPSHVNYSLSAQGLRLMEPLHLGEEWAVRLVADVSEARERLRATRRQRGGKSP